MVAGGPNDIDHHWTIRLEPGRGVHDRARLGRRVPGGLAGRDRRADRAPPRPSGGPLVRPDLPVIFNDYMNTLMGDPTTEKLLPLIDAAAEVGAEYFCIDAGWYDDGGDWWAQRRRLAAVDHALPRRRSRRGPRPHPRPRHGARPVAGAGGDRRPTARSPSGCRTTRSCSATASRRRARPLPPRPAPPGRPRAPRRRRSTGWSTTSASASSSSTTTSTPARAPTRHAHSRSATGCSSTTARYLDWLDGVLDRHPDLLLENCASGAMRMDYALLSRLQLQSTSDQQDPCALRADRRGRAGRRSARAGRQLGLPAAGHDRRGDRVHAGAPGWPDGSTCPATSTG